MKASSQDKLYYFNLRDQIQRHMSNTDGCLLSKDELHNYLKWYADLDHVSMKTISHEDLQILKEWSKQFAATIGLDIKDQEE